MTNTPQDSIRRAATLAAVRAVQGPCVSRVSDDDLWSLLLLRGFADTIRAAQDYARDLEPVLAVTGGRL